MLSPMGDTESPRPTTLDGAFLTVEERTADRRDLQEHHSQETHTCLPSYPPSGACQVLRMPKHVLQSCARGLRAIYARACCAATSRAAGLLAAGQPRVLLTISLH